MMDVIGGQHSSVQLELVVKAEVRQEERGSTSQPVDCESSSTHPKWLLSILTDGGQQSQTKSRIQKVPMILRDIEKNKECYDPMVVSIGPYHHGQPKLELVEKLKTTIAQQLVSGRVTGNFNKFDETARRARECYAEGSTDGFGEEEFRRMMFLDGCFLLDFIDCLMNNKGNTKVRKHLKPIVIRDMFLLENQLPLLVLRELKSLVVPGDNGDELVCKFINKSGGLKVLSPQNYNKEAPHLLHLLRTQLIGTAPPQNHGKSPAEEKYNYYSFRTVNELKAAGIKCNQSNGLGLKNVEFVPGLINGDLLLPHIDIDDGTKTRFLNLVAYEACPDFDNDYALTSYVHLMDSLVDSADDVKELRSKGILRNGLGNDQQVADLLNELAINLVPNNIKYRKVKNKIENFYRKGCRKRMSELLHTHFSSPWTMVGFFAAVLLLLLTLTQTVFTVYSAL